MTETHRPAGPGPPAVSVVVPAHEVEDFLGECLGSIIVQPLASWEAIVVVDGSTDRSESIARAAARADPRIRVIVLDENAGPGAARNVGIAAARGTHVAFVDGDDVLTPDGLAILVTEAMATGADIVAGRAVDVATDGTESIYWTQRGEPFRSGVHGAQAATVPELLDDHVVWNKVYRRSLLEDHHIAFSEGVHCEDLLFSARALLAAGAVTVLPEIVYRHRRHGSAISADYLRERTLGDWMDQAGAALGALRSAPDPVAERYRLMLLRRQWWSRFTRWAQATPGRDSAAFAEFTAGIVAGMGPAARARLGEPVRAAVELVAEAGPTWLDLAGNVEALPEVLTGSPDPAAVLAYLGGLPLATDAEREFAASVLVQRALFPLPGRDDADFTAVVEWARRAADTVDRIGVERVARRCSRPAGSTTPVAVTLAAALEREQLAASARSLVQLDAALRIEIAFASALGLRETDALDLVLRSQGSPGPSRVRVIPLGRSANQGTVVEVARDSLWIADIPLVEDLAGEEWRAWVRVRRPEAPPRDILVEWAPAAEETRTHDAAIAAPGTGSAGSSGTVRRSPGPHLQFRVATAD